LVVDKKKNSPPRDGSSDGPGAWVPWRQAEALCRLGLTTPSHWRVLLAVSMVAARYGGTVARLGVDDLARMTGLAPRTVKAALAALIARGLVIRVGRYRRLAVDLGGDRETSTVVVTPPPNGESGGDGARVDESVRRAGRRGAGACKVAPARGNLTCTSPTSFYVSSLQPTQQGGWGAFSPCQAAIVADVLAEAAELMGPGAVGLTLPAEAATRLGLPPATTYTDARAAVARSGDRSRARDFTAAVLRLRRDERVQGRELGPDPSTFDPGAAEDSRR
jgi:hypothetical protein